MKKQLKNLSFLDFEVLDVNVEKTNKGSVVTGAELSAEDLKSISRYMAYAIKRTEQQLLRWSDHPTDEGQIHYVERREKLRHEIKLFKEILKIKEAVI